MAEGDPQLPVSTRTAAMAVQAPPTLQTGLVPRARLASLLQTGVQTRLCLLATPAGCGKTTLLGQWHAAAGGDWAAWVLLEAGGNDPTRFWTWVVEALWGVEPNLGGAALAALCGPSVDLDRVVLPSVLGEFDAVDRQLVLVPDDYQLVTDATCLRTLDLFLEHLPAGVHVVLATRVDPPLSLARLRARGSWPSSGPPTCRSATRRPPSCSTACWGWGWRPRTWRGWWSGPRAGRPAGPGRPVPAWPAGPQCLHRPVLRR
jgi:ATP/maltotriose-dependent transcriptional regulator MalT